MTNLLATVIQALGPGAMLGLLALGIVLIYRSTGMLNLAHGVQAALGGYIYWDLATNAGLPNLLALVITVVLSGVVGMAIQLLVMRPLRGAAPLTLLIGSIGVLIVIQSVLLLRYGSNPRSVPSVLPKNAIEIMGGRTLGADRLALIGIGVTVTLLLWAIYRYTRFGTATAAVAENPVAAATLGHDSSLVAMGNWFLGGALAGLAGALLAPITGLDLVTMNGLIVPALAAALAGGMVSFPLTVVGAVVIQVAQAVTTTNVDIRGAGAISTFVILVILLLWRGEAVPDRGYVGVRMPSLGSGRISWPWLVAWFVAAMVVIHVGRDIAWTDAILTSMMVGVVMLSVVVVTGYAGQVSLAQFALAGVGAVIACEVVQRVELPFLVLLVVAAVGTVPIGILLSLAAMRMRGTSLAVVTLAFNVLLFATVFSRADVISVPTVELFGLDMSALLYPERYLTLVIVVFAVLGLGVANLRRSATGRRMVAVRGNERAAAAIGIRVGVTKTTAFAIASGIAAVGGVLLAFRSSALTYTQFASFASIDQLAWTVIGGLGFIAGPLLGMGFTPGGIGTQLADTVYTDQFSWLPLIGGLALIVTMIAHQDGVAAVIAKQVEAVRRAVRSRGQGPRVASHAPEDGKSAGEVAPPSATEGSRAAGARHTAAAGQSTTPRRDAGRAPDRRRGGRPLRIEDVSVAFGGVKALQHVNLVVEPGVVHGLIGPNGAGKSTMLDVVSGFVRPQTGEVHLGDQRLDSLAVWRRAHAGIGRSFQSLELFPDLTVRDNLRVAAEAFSRSNPVRDMVWPKREPVSEATREAVKLLGLEPELDAAVGSLPYGKRRLVAIARALATDSEIIMLDEPASGLSEIERAELRAVVRSMAGDFGRGVLLIEHDVDLVMATSDVVTALNFGQVIAHGTPDHVRTHQDVIASYLGVSEPDDSSEMPVPAVPEGV